MKYLYKTYLKAFGVVLVLTAVMAVSAVNFISEYGVY
jgi:hypothetical protein